MENEKAEIRFTFFGWKAVVAIILILAFIGSYIFNLTGQKVSDKGALEAIRFHIYTKHLRTKLNAMDLKDPDKTGKEILGLKVNIKSAEGACAFINSFYEKKDMVIKTTWTVSIDDKEGEIQEGFFEVHYLGLTDSWQCYRQVGRMNYYINMIDDD